MSCLVLNMHSGEIVHAESKSNAKSIFASRAIESGMIHFASSETDLQTIPRDVLSQMWSMTYQDYYRKLKTNPPPTEWVDMDRDGLQESCKKLWNAWIVTYPKHDIWEGRPVVDDEMNVIAKNERDQRKKATAKKASSGRKRISKTGPWKLNNHSEELFEADKFKQHRIVGAAMVKRFGTTVEFTRELWIEVVKAEYEAGNFRVSKKTQELGDVMWDQLIDWYISPFVKGGMIDEVKDEVKE